MAAQNIHVLHEESVPIPGGKRFRYEWEMQKEGANIRVNSHGLRIDTESSYTFEMNIETISSDGSEDRALRQVIFGVKGEIDGTIRHDRVFVTVFNPDGTNTQQEIKDVPVRLDLAHLDQQPLATMLESVFGTPAAEKPGWMPGSSCKLPNQSDSGKAI